MNLSSIRLMTAKAHAGSVRRVTATRSVAMTLAVAFKPRLPIPKKNIPSRQRRLKSSPQISFVVINTILP